MFRAAIARIVVLFLAVVLVSGNATSAAPAQVYEREDTRNLVALVNEAANLVQAKGDAAFTTLRMPGSRFRQKDAYVFVLDTKGNMLVHADPTMEGKNQLQLKDVHGKPIIRGLMDAATAIPGKSEGWYHYEWPVPGEILPRWKSSYVRAVSSPSGRYVVGSGMYDDRMERAFVVDMVQSAVGLIEQKGPAAFPLLRDPTGPFVAKSAYIFVIDPSGVELVNPAFPNLEGRKVLDVKDTHGKPFVREMLDLTKTGWVDYMWPKPGESVSTRKSTYVGKAKVGDSWLLVGCGVYLADAPKEAKSAERLTAPQLMKLVREAGALLSKQGEQAYPELRKKGSKWFRGETYFFVWTTEGKRTLHAADPSLEGQDASGASDVLGRQYGKMFLEVANAPSGEGWVHYMYPEAGSLFPKWKSTFLKRVTFPSGKHYLVGCGIYDMQMDKAFVEDVVERASALVAAKGKDAFAELRDKKGPFVFLDTYVFVDTPSGIELVNAAQPSFEGKNVVDLKDQKGKPVARAYIDAAMKSGSAWVEYHWYKPGENTPSRKQAYVRKVQFGSETFVVGSGLYVE